MGKESLLEILIKNSDSLPDTKALCTSDLGIVLTYKQLLESVNNLVEGLSNLGIKRNSRVAAVLSRGIDWAVMFLAVPVLAPIIPLSLECSREQYIYYFEAIGVDCLLLEEGFRGPAKDAAEALGVTIIYFCRRKRGKESFYCIENIPGSNRSFIQNSMKQFLSGDDDAILMLTSGTTSTPKIVPISHKALYLSASSEQLTSQDCCLIVTPMFKWLALSNYLSALSGGCCTVIADSFQPDTFFNLLKSVNPTWFCISPALHKSLVEYAERNNIVLNSSRLRWVFSSGANLPEILAEKMAELYKVPVIVYYGLTETKVLTCSHVGPKGYKKGSVGVAYKSEIAIMDEKGNILTSPEIGEIVVRGERVMKAYENKDICRNDTFHGEWFRTGDLGFLDEDGYLFLKGRIKELINKGGEKVSPFEVEEELFKHPSILDAVVFPIPDDYGYEDIGCLIVLAGNDCITLKDIRQFLSGRLSHNKMPARLYSGKSIPVSESGKIARNSLFEAIEGNDRYTLVTNQNFEEPIGCSERILKEVFGDILTVPNIGRNENFFELGGDSLKAAALFTKIQEKFQKQIPLSYIYSHGTIENLAEYLDNCGAGVYSFLVPIQEYGTKSPLFFVHPANGEVVAYRHLAQYMPKDRPIYGLRMNLEDKAWEHPLSLGSIAQKYLEEVRIIQPQGPYFLSGTCLGGTLAYEMARQLKERQQDVAFLGMFDSIISLRKSFSTKIKRTVKEIKKKTFKDAFDHLVNKSIRRIRFYKVILSMFIYKIFAGILGNRIVNLINKEAVLRLTAVTYRIGKYDGEIVFFKPEEMTPSTMSSLEKWAQLVEKVNVVPVEVSHNALFLREHSKYLAEKLQEAIDQAAYI